MYNYDHRTSSREVKYQDFLRMLEDVFQSAHKEQLSGPEIRVQLKKLPEFKKMQEWANNYVDGQISVMLMKAVSDPNSSVGRKRYDYVWLR